MLALAGCPRTRVPDQGRPGSAAPHGAAALGAIGGAVEGPAGEDYRRCGKPGGRGVAFPARRQAPGQGGEYPMTDRRRRRRRLLPAAAQGHRYHRVPAARRVPRRRRRLRVRRAAGFPELLLLHAHVQLPCRLAVRPRRLPAAPRRRRASRPLDYQRRGGEDARRYNVALSIITFGVSRFVKGIDVESAVRASAALIRGLRLGARDPAAPGEIPP